jgi:hypothetical protein
VLWHDGAGATLRLDRRRPADGLASSVMPGHPDVFAEPAGPAGEQRHVRVASAALPMLLAAARAATAAGGALALKLDVEGAEYELLRRPAALAAVCAHADVLLMEWHPAAAPAGAPAGFEAAAAWALETPPCRTRVWHDCSAE